MNHRVVLSLIAAVATGVAFAPSAASAAGGKAYVAFGDSYASGPGLAGADTNSCLRSTVNYAAKLADAYGLVPTGDWADFTCASAKAVGTTAIDLNAQVTKALPADPALHALGTNTVAVTITIGGNDNWRAAGLTANSPAAAIGQCAGGSVGPTQNCATRTDLVTAADITPQKFATYLSPVITRIRAAVPANAKIILVSYPTILPRAGQPGCADPYVGAWNFASSEVSYVDGLTLALKNAAVGAKSILGASFMRSADLYTASLGHDLCQPQAQQWVQAPIFEIYNWQPRLRPNSLHPSAAGMQAFVAPIIAGYTAAS